LTATATPETRKDILTRLGLEDPLVHVAPFDRPNLRFEVHPCGPTEKLIRLRRILKDLSGLGSQIVYVGRRRDADEIADELESDGFGAVAYHAGMDPTERKLAQEAWLAGRKPIAVATIAFGMGIDKPDVRAVIHYQHPASLESYYQEAGRAGRDGQPARCILLFSGKDSALAHFFIRNRYPTREQVLELAKDVPREGISAEHVREAGDSEMTDEQRNVALLALQEEKWLRREDRGEYRRAEGYGKSLSLNRLFRRKEGDYQRLEAMVAYGNEKTCHRSVLLEYFGEQLPAKYRCGNCSACEGGTASVGQAAATDEVERILRRRWDLLASAGLIHKTGVARFLAGSSSKRLPAGVRDLPEFGILANLPMKKLRHLAEEAIGRVMDGDHAGETVSRDEVAEATSPDTTEIFWQSKERAFTREELVSRSVARQRGLHILALALESGSGLSPSRMAGVLRGSIGAAGGPDVRSLSQWRQLGSSSYPEVLEDVLAMWAKGYLAPASGRSRKLVISDKGRQVLQKSKS
jgi:ATP-dependent DNA helicase RecQ